MAWHFVLEIGNDMRTLELEDSAEKRIQAEDGLGSRVELDSSIRDFTFC